MKIVFTSVLMMIMMAAQAMPVNMDSTNKEKKSEVVTPANPSTPAANVQQLQQENILLKSRLAELENRLEDEKGLLQYNYTMLKLVSRLEADKKADGMEDLQAEITFTRLMNRTLELVKADSVR